MAAKDQVYYLYGGAAVKFSLMDLFQSLFGSIGAGGAVAMVCAVLVGLVLAGLVAALSPSTTFRWMCRRARSWR